MKKEEIEDKIEKLRLEISDEEIKLKFINEVGVDDFDENQFKVYKVLQTIKLDLSDFDKSKIIADLINVKPSEPSKYPKELVDLWNRLTKNIVVEHRGSSIFFYDTIKNIVIMENGKALHCRDSGFWSEFRNTFYLQDTNIQEFIQYMVWNTFKLMVNTPAQKMGISEYVVWNTFKLSILKTQINQK